MPARKVNSEREPAIEKFGRRLRMVMGKRPEEPVADRPAPPLPPELEFIGYAAD
jgi:hypothetical protein